MLAHGQFFFFLVGSWHMRPQSVRSVNTFISKVFHRSVAVEMLLLNLKKDLMAEMEHNKLGNDIIVFNKDEL